MEAVFLVDGLDTRLRNVVSDRPEPMALTEGCLFMEYVTRGLARHGIADIILAARHKGFMVEKHFGSRDKFGFHASYTYEETLLGTAGAIKNAGRLVTQDRFYVLNTDTFYQVDYARLSKIMDVWDLDIALILREMKDVSRYGQAILDREGVLATSSEKAEGARTGTINGDVYLIERELPDKISEGRVSPEDDMISRWLDEGKRLGGLINDGYLIDIDIPEAYYQFQENVRRKVIW